MEKEQADRDLRPKDPANQATGRAEGRATRRAREFFPRGLIQPEGVRFSIDALLLSCFADFKNTKNVLDLGTGCGVVGLGLLLKNPNKNFRVTGMDVNPEMIASARENADLLGFKSRFEVVRGDVGKVREDKVFEPESFELAVCNPPYRRQGQGRRPTDTYRNAARFESRAKIHDFVSAASFTLRNKGNFCLIYLPERLSALFTAFAQSGLEPKRMRFIHSRGCESAKLTLIQARKNTRPGLIVEPPLILYQGQGPDTELTHQALKFCPFLECNLKRQDPGPGGGP
ncbi:MAG: methyltransferase [Thermodesulfobacteriota bacterium]|nr:methyltransferase [Thermodesulfobacteriota bacterium]